jgi:hypothetical protein
MDYQKGKIYKIESHLGDKIYVGSTTKEYLSQRMASHRSDYLKWKKGKGNKTTSFNLFDEYGAENCQITLIELYPCQCNDELHAKEAGYIKSLNCVNRVHLGRTPKEYREGNKEAFKEYMIKYNEDNKDKLKENRKIYNANNKQKLNEYLIVNKEKIKETRNIYLDKNRDEINRKRRERRAAKKQEQQSS